MKNRTYYNQLSDSDLITEYLSGSNLAMGVLYSRYYKKVYYKCLSFTTNPDKAFDFSEDILIKAFEKLPSFKGTSAFSTWLFSITNNHCIEMLRKEKKSHGCDIEQAHQIAYLPSDIEEETLRSEKMTKMLATIESLPAKDKELLIMKYMHNAKISEIQKETGLSASAVKMRLLRVKGKLNALHS